MKKNAFGRKREVRMGKGASTARENEYYKARMAAANRDERFSSREKTAEAVGIDRTRLARIEGGTVEPHPDETALLAKAYGAPELRNHYCAEICPLGKGRVRRTEASDFDRITLQVLGALQNIEPLTDKLVSIAADGEVDETETAELAEVLDLLGRIGAASESLRLWAEKNSGKKAL